MIYTDRPGIVAVYGQEFGEAGINIAGMQIARRAAGGQALSVLTVDSPRADEELLDEVREAIDADLFARDRRSPRTDRKKSGRICSRLSIPAGRPRRIRCSVIPRDPNAIATKESKMSAEYMSSSVSRSGTRRSSRPSRSRWTLPVTRSSRRRSVAAGQRIAASAPLRPQSEATRIVPSASGAVFTDGPFGEVREVVTGFYTFAADSPEQARELAALVPTGGWLELYPIAADARVGRRDPAGGGRCG